MDTCCSGKLRQTADRILHFSRSHHHKIRQLVYDDYDLRNMRRRSLSLRDLHSLYLVIVFFKIPHMKLRKGVVAAHHL